MGRLEIHQAASVGRITLPFAGEAERRYQRRGGVAGCAPLGEGAERGGAAVFVGGHQRAAQAIGQKPRPRLVSEAGGDIHEPLKAIDTLGLRHLTEPAPCGCGHEYLRQAHRPILHHALVEGDWAAPSRECAMQPVNLHRIFKIGDIGFLEYLACPCRTIEMN